MGFLAVLPAPVALCAALLCCHVTVADDNITPTPPASHTDDPHGGVVMGVVNNVCDNAQDHIEIDWDPESTEEYTCAEERTQPAATDLHYYHCDQTADKPIHKCFPTALNYTDDLPTSGPHRPLWPVYGEYTYVPPQRWLHNLEHGGIVFLYHPCADSDEIDKFKSLAKGCLRRHIIAAYKKLPPQMNFAVLAWKCKMVLSDVNVGLITKFVKARALKGREAVSSDGQYNAGLLHPAHMVTDLNESVLCPGITALDEFMQHVQEESRKRQHHNREKQNRLKNILRKLGILDSLL